MYKASKDKAGGIIYESFLSGCIGCGAALLLLFIGAVIMQRGGPAGYRPRIVFAVSVTLGCFLTALRLGRKVRLGALSKILLSALCTLSALGITAVIIGRGEVTVEADLLSIGMSLIGAILGSLPSLCKSNKDYRKVTSGRTIRRHRSHHN